MTVTKPVSRVVSVCSKKDIETWSVACTHIVKYIFANEYLLVVPDGEVEEFKSVTCKPYRVLPESSFVGALKDRLKELLPFQNHDRVGWYLQQFIKIAAAKDSPISDDSNQIVLIWDADTVPLKNLSFSNLQGQVTFYKGHERHSPYFGLIKKLFPWSCEQPFSFIAQCFPAKISWLRDFCGELEVNGQTWIETILAKVDHTQRAGFSEYESLGSFIWAKYPNQVALNEGSWERNGRSLLGSPMKLNTSHWLGLSKSFDYISFEAWDRGRGIKSILKSTRNRIHYELVGRKLIRSLKRKSA